MATVTTSSGQSYSINDNQVNVGTKDAPKVVTAGGYNSPTSATNTSPQVPVDAIGKAQDLTLPTSGQFKSSAVESTFAELAPFLEQAPVQDTSDMEMTDKQLKELLGGSFQTMASRGEFTSQLEDMKGIGELDTEVSALQKEVRAKELAFRREREALAVEPGLTAAQKNARLADIGRKQATELADRMMILDIKQGQLDSAQKWVDRKVELKFADEQARMEGLKFFYTENKDQLTKAQDRNFSQMLTRENRAFELAKGKYERLETTKYDLMKNAQLNGAPSSVMNKIASAGTLQEAFGVAGSYGMSIDDKISMARYREMLSGLGGQTGQLSASEMTGIPSQDIAKIIDKTGAKNNTNIQNAIGVIAGTEKLAQRNKEGTFIGMAPGIRFPFLRGGEARTERQYNVGDIQAINLKVQQWASGASLTKEQTRQVKQMVPDKNDTDNQAMRKINQLTQYMLGQVTGELAAQGIQSVAPSFDFFNETGSELQYDENGNIIIPGNTSDEDFWSK